MLDSFVGIKSISQYTLIVEKSRFISFAFPVFSKNDVTQNLDKIKKQYSDATHICYAFVMNDDGIKEKYFDDGEPSGTAGYPICAVIKKKNLMNVLIVVVRYFGKIKLGASGLTRTYSACASKVLDENEEHTFYLAKKINFSIYTNDYYKYVNFFKSNKLFNKKEFFENENCIIEFDVKNEDFEEIKAQLLLINNKSILNIGEIYL